MNKLYKNSIFKVPRTELIGDPDRYVKAGSIVVLRCVVRGALEPPNYIIWYHGFQQIYAENYRGWRIQFERDVETDSHSSVSPISVFYIKRHVNKNFIQIIFR